MKRNPNLFRLSYHVAMIFFAVPLLLSEILEEK